MDNMKELSMEELDKVSGGSQKTIRSRTAVVYGGPGRQYAVNGKLESGTVVNFGGTVSYNEQDGKTWYLINSPIYGWVTKQDLGL